MDKGKGSTSWQEASKWYGKLTEEGGHYYHQQVVIPGVLHLLNFKSETEDVSESLLDLACGNGVLASYLPAGVEYLGLDMASDLITQAQRQDHSKNHRYLLADVTKALPVKEKFTHAAIVLALQNIRSPQRVLFNVRDSLVEKGVLVIVFNHPCFRIPRQSGWGIDEKQKLQFRKVYKYMTTMEIPIITNPSLGQRSSTTLSFHRPLSLYIKMLKNAGFAVVDLEEWTSDKASVGKAAKMENRSRAEIPLFLTIKAIKI